MRGSKIPKWRGTPKHNGENPKFNYIHDPLNYRLLYIIIIIITQILQCTNVKKGDFSLFSSYMYMYIIVNASYMYSKRLAGDGIVLLSVPLPLIMHICICIQHYVYG